MSTPNESCHDGFRPGRLWSLWEMINYQFSLIAARMHALVITEESFRQRASLAASALPHEMVSVLASGGVSTEVTQRDVEQALGYINGSTKAAEELSLPTVAHRVERFGVRIREPLSVAILHAEYRALREAYQHDLNGSYVYAYPKDKASRLLKVPVDWAAAIAAFRSIGEDCNFATDCYAFSDNVASVFHCMRILEVGLKALAANVGLTFDLQQWQNIIDEIESKIKLEQQSLKKGAPKNTRLQFLSEAAKEFFYFKEGWRNHVSHNRANYDEHQALSVLEHTRGFMNHLASQLSEVP